MIVEIDLACSDRFNLVSYFLSSFRSDFRKVESVFTLEDETLVWTSTDKYKHILFYLKGLYAATRTLRDSPCKNENVVFSIVTCAFLLQENI